MRFPSVSDLRLLSAVLSGTLHYDRTMRTLYATDASAYRELPLAVAFPASVSDLQQLIHFARRHGTSLIPRTAGTSLAGQVVGAGIVVDISRHFNKVLEVNKSERWVRLQPALVRNELNARLKNQGLYFGPETSTANRAMIGGMVGNNSCGSNSIVYGSTRDHLLEVKGLLSDGSPVCFGALNRKAFDEKCRLQSFEGEIYRKIRDLLSDTSLQAEIRANFPKAAIPRRNTGYALDLLMDAAPLNKESAADFNFCKLIAGSEGTLLFITEVKLRLLPLPPPEKVLVAAHFQTVDEALRANLVALQHRPSACELMDHYILDCTKSNIAQQKNRFFVQGEPGAILVVEIARNTATEVEKDAQTLVAAFKSANLGYHFPIVPKAQVERVWQLRKAGLGLLSNIPGDAKPVAVIEDTAVDVRDLPEFIADFNLILKKYGLYCVHYAHAGSGELHLRPIINLKTAEGNRLFRLIATEIATLVKRYGGSLSGEHGDGRLRGEFIAQMVGARCFEAIREVKHIFDPAQIFNPGKIVDTPPMDSALRYMPAHPDPPLPTTFDFSKNKGILRSVELCNGSGDCRKSHLTGGTMCPSYMATRHEKDTTRARANILREFLTHSPKKNKFDHTEIKDVMALCLSCKGCKAECPSNVDMAKLKAEFLQQYHNANGVPLRSLLVAHFSKMNALAARMPSVYNWLLGHKTTSKIFKSLSGFAQARSMPLLHKTTLKKWCKKHLPHHKNKGNIKKTVYLFCDEFTNYHDTPLGIKAVELLERLGYAVKTIPHLESGRTFISKGLLKSAKAIATKNIAILGKYINEAHPLLGLEPSALLTLRDEYLELCNAAQKEDAQKIAQNTFLFDEFIAAEAQAGAIDRHRFTTDKKLIRLHGHCHQKALSSLTPTKKMLSLPPNYQVRLIPSGCCGMAGSFGYEAAHYALSMQIGELVLFPTIRAEKPEVIIAAPGTSCRHQIKDGTGRTALHPVEILWDALEK